mmetsp:Transcript_26665/g.47330  ORF Transcript_26665/g.47330 Transcript_26665/m.47330 type:complete len:228 (+) Transcript_26665:458-1141(+)
MAPTTRAPTPWWRWRRCRRRSARQRSRNQCSDWPGTWWATRSCQWTRPCWSPAWTRCREWSSRTGCSRSSAACAFPTPQSSTTPPLRRWPGSWVCSSTQLLRPLHRFRSQPCRTDLPELKWAFRLHRRAPPLPPPPLRAGCWSGSTSGRLAAQSSWCQGLGCRQLASRPWQPCCPCLPMASHGRRETCLVRAGRAPSGSLPAFCWRKSGLYSLRGPTTSRATRSARR